MKKICTILLAVTALSACAGKSKSHMASEQQKQQMMKAWEAYATPGAPHKVFNSMVGKWKYTSQFWESADAKPEASSGTSTLKLILGGRFLQNDTKGKMMGMRFEGMGITGYDNLKGRYDTFWLDNMGTGTMVGTAVLDASTNTLKESGKFTCPCSKKNTRAYTAEWKVVDKNNMIYSMYGEDMSGKEHKQMELVFKRIN